MTNSEAKATPRPFISNLVHDGKFLRTEGHQPFYDGIIADLRTWGTPLEGYQAKDRADYICKAVNNHDSLLLALRGMVEQLEYVLETKNTMGAYSQLEHARQAIANAEGR